MTTKPPSAQRLANDFVRYLFKEHQGSSHIRQVASWIGFLLKAVENLPGVEMRRSRTRQVEFTYRDHRFKARYNHKAKPRGGIDILQVLPGKGSPDGALVLQVTSLDAAEEAYHLLQGRLDGFIDFAQT